MCLLSSARIWWDNPFVSVVLAFALFVLVAALLIPLAVVRAEVSRSDDSDWALIGENRGAWEQALSSPILLPSIAAAFRYLIRVRPALRRKADS
jgi:hypothetical protein